MVGYVIILFSGRSRGIFKTCRSKQLNHRYLLPATMQLQQQLTAWFVRIHLFCTLCVYMAHLGGGYN